MATRPLTSPAQTTSRTKSLPLSLQPYHLFYAGVLSSIVVVGTIYSVLNSTHLYNVMLSSSASFSAVAAPKSASASSLTSSTSRLDQLVEAAKLPATIFADRRNLLNRIFIKYAWAWTTIAFLAQIFTLRAGGSPVDINGKGKGKERDEGESSDSASAMESTKEATISSAMSISVLRYLVATMFWIFFASWFFGPPIMERTRHYTGAVCMPATSSSLNGMTLPGSVDAQFCYARRPLTSSSHPQLFQTGHQVLAAESGGSLKAQWKGGHDISGHTFILVLSTVYLLEELTPYLPHLLPSSLQVYLQHLIPRRFWSAYNPFSASSAVSSEKASINTVVALSILALVFAWSISLLFTALFFHTPQEKMSGLFVGLAAGLLLPKTG